MPESDSIIREFSTLVNSSVIRALKTCNWAVEHDDAMQIGWEALLKALKKRDLKTGVGFYVYARTRVYGSVLDASKKQTKLVTENGVQRRVDNRPLAMDAYDEETVDRITGNTVMRDSMPTLNELTLGIKGSVGYKIIHLRFGLGYHMKEIYLLLGIGMTCASKHYTLALTELRKTIKRSDYRD